MILTLKELSRSIPARLPRGNRQGIQANKVINTGIVSSPKEKLPVTVSPLGCLVVRVQLNQGVVAILNGDLKPNIA